MSLVPFLHPLVIQLIFDESREFYVFGEVLSGKIVFTLTDSPLLVTRVSVFVRCQEYCDFNGRVLTYDLICLRAEENFESLIEKCNTIKHGQFEAKFSVALDDGKVAWMPPNLKTNGGCIHGVRWVVTAEVGFTNLSPQFELKTTRKILPFEFHPGGVVSPLENNLIYRWLATSSSPLIKYLCPTRLPQWPERFVLYLSFDYSQKTQIDTLDIYLQKRIATQPNDSQIFEEESPLAQKRNVVVSNTSDHISLICHIEKREPAAFCNRLYSVKYLIRLKITSANHEQNIISPIDIMPPHLEPFMGGYIVEDGPHINSPPAYDNGSEILDV